MALFEPALTLTLKHEDSDLSGKVTNDPTADRPSAVARFGINSASHPKALSDGFYTMDHDRALQYAADIYKYEYFAPICGYQIRNQDVANKFFDLAVNSGIGQATKIVQRACNEVAGQLQIGVQVDGRPGQKTLDAINATDPVELLAEIKQYAAQFYRDWAARTGAAPNLLSALLIRANS